MNCCDDYGNCTQGKDCPVRTEVYIPEKVPMRDRLYLWLCQLNSDVVTWSIVVIVGVFCVFIS
jgi:hypothetical protein